MPQTLNRYSYSWNSPITLVDPDGNQPLNAGMTAALSNVFRSRVHGGRVYPFPFLSSGTRAMTLGNVILLSTSQYPEGIPWQNYNAVNLEGVKLLSHEYTHVRQYRNLDFGPFLPNFFPTAYALTSVWTGHMYSRSSYFEGPAYLMESGIVRSDAEITVHASGAPSPIRYDTQYFTVNPFGPGSIRGVGGLVDAWFTGAISIEGIRLY